MKTKKRSEFSKLPSGDKTLLIIAYAILGLFLVAIILPIIYIILASFIDPVTLQNSGLTFDFSKWTLTAYERVLGNSQIWVGFKNALIYSILFTIISVVVTLLAAYPMSRADFKGRGFFNTIFVITMFFGGGLIPTYLLISNLGMLDTIWAILIPGAFSVWNMIIARTYYMGIPRDLQEAAEIDGADAMIYLNSASKQPLQLVLRAILIQSQPEPGMVSDMQSTAARAQLAELLKYATIIISSLPLMIMYPFFQKYFDNGIMAGAVKG